MQVECERSFKVVDSKLSTLLTWRVGHADGPAQLLWNAARRDVDEVGGSTC